MAIELEAANADIGVQQVWEDVVGSLIGRRLFSNAGKVDYNYANNSVTFASGGDIDTENDVVTINNQFPHAAELDSEIRLHLHWEQVTSNEIEFTVDYRIQVNGSAKATAWTRITCNSADDSKFPYVSGTLNQITEFSPIDMTGADLSATLQFRLARTDATTGDIEATFIDFHVLMDTLGSREEYVK